MSDEDTKLDMKGLEKFIKALKESPNVEGRIGVLGDKANRSKSDSAGLSNADVGAKHEFGVGVPKRSWLREPITDHLANDLKKSGALEKDVMAQVIKTGSVIPWLKKVMIVAEGVVQEAFASGGYGKWAPWRPGYQSNTGMILVDTTQLRDSITSEVKE